MYFNDNVSDFELDCKRLPLVYVFNQAEVLFNLFLRTFHFGNNENNCFKRHRRTLDHIKYLLFCWLKFILINLIWSYVKLSYKILRLTPRCLVKFSISLHEPASLIALMNHMENCLVWICFKLNICFTI